MYLTPASISGLTQLLMGAVITAFLGLRQRGRRTAVQDRLLLGLFAALTLFSATLFLEASLLPAERLPAVYLENPAFGLVLILLLQFAYHFPQAEPAQRRASRWALLLSGAYALGEAGFAVWRLAQLAHGQVEFRPDYLDYGPVLGLAGVIAVFARRTASYWHQRASRQFALVFTLPLGLAVINVLNALSLVPTPVYSISMAVGVLVTEFLFALIYLISRPETTSLTVKLSGTVFTGLLAILGVIAWLITPVYTAYYQPQVEASRTWRFAPNAQGGYTLAAAPYAFETELGRNLNLVNSTVDRLSQAALDFEFPFYGRRYSRVFVTDDGALSLGEALDYKDLQARFSTQPALFPFLIDLDPELNAAGGVYARAAEGRLVVTYWQVRASGAPEREYTFQAVLYADGRFDFSYQTLPASAPRYANDSPAAALWVIGAKPAGPAAEAAVFLSLPADSGPAGVLLDEYRVFRRFLDQLMRPLAGAVLVSSLLLLLGLPVALHYGVTRPLDVLLRGVLQFNQGQRDQRLPVEFNDEIGFLTESFNTLAGELNGLIQHLELRIADRTADLRAANDQLRKLSSAVEQSPSAIIITDADARIEYTNPAFTASSGYTLEEVRGRNPRLFQSGLTPPETFQELWLALAAGRTWRGELANRRKNGETYWEYTVMAPIRAASGAVTHFVAIKYDITARKQAEQELERLARTDALTGLFNRRHFLAEAAALLSRARGINPEVAVLMMDIDHFKRINDTYGHLVGDGVLREVAQRLRTNLRPTDLLGRYGGEEFVVLLVRTPDPLAGQIADRLLNCVRETPVASEAGQIAVTISLGVAGLGEAELSLDELLSRADQALYRAKQAGRDRWAVWQPSA